MLTIKILLYLIYFKKTIPSKHYLQFLLFKENIFFLEKIHLIKNYSN